MKFAVISFPGTNCEEETARAFRRAGMEAETVLWNDPGVLNRSRLDEFAGYCVAGGFSYEDRGRSGVVAAQEPITDVLREEAKKGKVILGICNGAQVLVETGLIPGFEDQSVGMALAWNEMKQGEEIVGTGYYNVWSYLKNAAPKGRSAFNDFEELLHVPIAHGEGRFVIEPELLAQLEENHQIIFKYCDQNGTVDSRFPITPNGAVASAAAVCNSQGNVMAIMPHPERDPKGNGQKIFESIRRWVEAGKKGEGKPLTPLPHEFPVEPLPPFDLEIYVRLIITDNAERTLEEALNRKGIPVNLERFEFFGIQLQSDQSVEEAIERIMQSGELANLNKHLIYIKTADGMFSYSKESGLSPSDFSPGMFAVTADRDDFVGQGKKEALNRHAGHLVNQVHSGVLWRFVDTDEEAVKQAIDSKVLYNPYSMKLISNLQFPISKKDPISKLETQN